MYPVTICFPSNANNNRLHKLANHFRGIHVSISSHRICVNQKRIMKSIRSRMISVHNQESRDLPHQSSPAGTIDQASPDTPEMMDPRKDHEKSPESQDPSKRSTLPRFKSDISLLVRVRRRTLTLFSGCKREQRPWSLDTRKYSNLGLDMPERKAIT